MLGYLTQISINDSVVESKKLQNIYNVHKALWEAFSDTAARNHIYTFKTDHILMLSQEKPKPVAWGNWITKEIPDSFLNSTLYYFEITFNPVFRKVQFDEHGNRKKNGKKIPIKNISALTAWIKSKGHQGGFSFDDIHISNLDCVLFQKKEHSTNLYRVVVTGSLRVTDKEQFTKSFISGIGPSRAFGFGMLLLKPYN